MTPRQHVVLDAIRTLSAGGVCPSYEELCDHTGVSSKGEMCRIIGILEEEGFVTRAGRARALMVTTPEPIEKMTRQGLIALKKKIDQRLAA